MEGGCLYYEGGFGSEVVLDHILMDHNGDYGSSSGGAILLAGRGEQITPEQCSYGISQTDIDQKEAGGLPYPPTTQPGCGLNLRFMDSIFWANEGWVAGGMRVVNVHPFSLQMDRLVWVDNTAIVGHDWGTWYYADMQNKFGYYDVTIRDTTFNGANRAENLCLDATMGKLLECYLNFSSAVCMLGACSKHVVLSSQVLPLDLEDG